MMRENIVCASIAPAVEFPEDAAEATPVSSTERIPVMPKPRICDRERELQ